MTLSKLFPELRMTIYSSFSSTKSALRYRVYVPTDKIMTVNQYKVITKELVRIITAAEFYNGKTEKQSRLHGIDTTKLHPVSLFYLPCQPRDLPVRISRCSTESLANHSSCRSGLENTLPKRRRVCFGRTEQTPSSKRPLRRPGSGLKKRTHSSLTLAQGSIVRPSRGPARSGSNVLRGKATPSFLP